MDRLSKWLVAVSMTTAVIVEAGLTREGWSPILLVTIIVLATSFALSWRFRNATAAFVLLFTYTFPAIIFLTRGQVEVGFSIVWVAALLGVILAGDPWKGWALPLPWRVPLVLWALTVSLVWPVVALREADFSLITLEIPRLSVTGPPGVPPLLAIVWIVNVTLVLGIGILWIDWLFAMFTDDERRFRLVVLGPLAVSWGITTAFAAYQMLFDMTFMNSGRFGFLQRASGLMFDANAFGVLAALGIPVVAAIAFLASWRGKSATIAAVVVFAWVGLWASGSRTALATGAIGTVFVIYYWADRAVRGRWLTRRSAFAMVVVALAVVIGPMVLQRFSDVGPWRRLAESLPTLTMNELWNRNGYGLNATRMFKEFPAFGIGVGAFNNLVSDYSRTPAGGGSIPFDNAQNWYRHQLVEFGIVGSLGWLWWTLSFGWFVLSSKLAGRARPAAGALKGALVAIALISMLGMPTQNVALTVTFWTLAFWYLLLAGEGPVTPAIAHRSIIPATTWIAVTSVVAMCAAGTAYEARHDLRVPMRAARFGWPYSYGFYAPENGPNGEFRWAGRRAVAVVDVTKPWVKLTIVVNHADVSRRPVAVTMSVDGAKALATTVSDSSPVRAFAPVRTGRSRIVVDASVSRVVRPADFGGADPRELGAMVQWEFVDQAK